MSTTRLISLEINYEIINDLLNNKSKNIPLMSNTKVKLCWHKELQIQDLRALRHVIDDAINNFYKDKTNGLD